MSALVLPLDWERAKLDEVRKILDDIPVGRRASYEIQWLDDPLCGGRVQKPILVLSFPEFAAEGLTPAFSVRLTTMPSNTILVGDKLKRHIRDAIETYFLRNGITIELPHDEIKVTA